MILHYIHFIFTSTLWKYMCTDFLKISKKKNPTHDFDMVVHMISLISFLVIYQVGHGEVAWLQQQYVTGISTGGVLFCGTPGIIHAHMQSISLVWVSWCNHLFSHSQVTFSGGINAYVHWPCYSVFTVKVGSITNGLIKELKALANWACTGRCANFRDKYREQKIWNTTLETHLANSELQNQRLNSQKHHNY